jgi:hypothetical protein
MEKELKSAVDPTGTLSDDFDPEEFNRQLKERVEGGPPQRRTDTQALQTSADKSAPAETPAAPAAEPVKNDRAGS